MKITKSQIVSMVAVKNGLSPTLVEAVVNCTLVQIQMSLRRGNDVTLHNFGMFRVVQDKERKSTDPNDIKKQLVIPATKRVRFKAFKAMKEMVND